MTGSIEEALGGSPEFTLVELPPTAETKQETYQESVRKVCFRLEGRCTGEVGLGAQVKQEDVQSLV